MCAVICCVEKRSRVYTPFRPEETAFVRRARRDAVFFCCPGGRPASPSNVVAADLGYRSSVRSSEWVAFLYFSYLAIVCWLRPLPVSRRLSVTGVSIGLAVAIFTLASLAPPGARDWLPFVYVSFGYYVTGRLFVKPSEALEAWLMNWDHRLLGDPTTRFAHWPGWLVAYLDLVYMCLFLLLPAGFAALVVAGHAAQAEPLLDDGAGGRSRRVRSAQCFPNSTAMVAGGAGGPRRAGRSAVSLRTWCATPRSA